MRKWSNDSVETVFWMLLSLAILIALLLPLMGTTGCCAKPASLVSLGKSELKRRLPNGNYEVSPGWIARRIQVERACLRLKTEGR